MAELDSLGVAGCGRMGLPMLKALVRAGFDARGFDIRAAADFGGDAGLIETDADAFAARTRTLIVVVRDDAQIRSLLFGRENLLGRANALATIVISSTVSPRFIAALRADIPAHVALVDAPMSGASIAADEARLSFMVGGPEPTVAALDPAFRAMGRTVHRLGALGNGATAKVLNNFVCAASFIATRKTLDWADALGLPRRALLDVMETSSGQSWFGSNIDRIEFSYDGFAQDNSVAILRKDVACALDAVPGGRDALGEVLIDAMTGLAPLPRR